MRKLSTNLARLTLGVFIMAVMVLMGAILPVPGIIASDDGVSIYRLNNKNTGEHLYTPYAEEANALASSGVWANEGTGWVAPSSGDPVFRLFNPASSNHLYTTDTNEVQVLTSSQGWVADNNGQAMFYSGGSVPIYRLFTANNNGLHHLTTDVNEYNALPAQGWAQEGVALYAVSSGGSSAPAPAEPAPAPAPSGNADITNVPAEYSIQADVNLNGSGTGFHAKLLGVTPTSAVSYGIQYDTTAPDPYKGAAFIIENVAHNNAGGQTYTRTGLSAVNQNYRILLAIQKDGTVDTYVNGEKTGSVQNPALANQTVALRVEGSARMEGDSVTATFSNIQVKAHGEIIPREDLGETKFETNSNVHVIMDELKSAGKVTVTGTIAGIGGLDWDSAYDQVSGIAQFN